MAPMKEVYSGYYVTHFFLNLPMTLVFSFQDLNSDQVSVSSLGSGEPDCSSLFEGELCPDPEGLSSPQREASVSVTPFKRSPNRNSRCLESPSAPPRLFRQASLLGEHVCVL